MTPRLTVKEQLLEAAIVAIDEKGEVGVRVDEILKEVGVTPPTLYHHFGNREGLIVEAQAERFSRMMRADFPKFIKAVQASKNKTDLRKAVGIAFSLRDDPKRLDVRFKRLNAFGAAYARPELAKRIVEIHDQFAMEIADALRPFQERGILRQDVDLEMVVAWYNGAVLGKLLVEVAPSRLDVEQWGKVMADAVEHLLFGN